MRIPFFNVFLLLILTSLFLSANAQPIVTNNLNKALAEKDAEKYISINIRLREQYDSRELYNQTKEMSVPAERRKLVVSTLKEFSAKSQKALLAFLETEQSRGNVKEIRPFWLANAINVRVKLEVVNKLRDNKEIARLDLNKERMPLPVDLNAKALKDQQTPQDKTDNAVWSVSQIMVPEVWEKGFRGRDVVVAVIDTGVNYNHADLQGNMWEHPDFPQHGYNTYDDNHNTLDPTGHGTHVAGTIAGNGASGFGTGVAPEASIMAMRVLGGSAHGAEAGVWEGIEFAVEHGAHILNLSLGWSPEWDPDFTMWRTVMDNTLSAGVIAAVASGNEGSINTPLEEVRTPGNVPPPWLHPDQTLTGGTSAVISVGATNFNNLLASFSSKGPVTWEDIAPYNDYPYDPEMGLIRPDVVAPGQSITSLAYDNLTGYTELSGTSMASPAVAGVMALLLSKNPYLTPSEMGQIVEETSHSFSGAKNNRYGSGRVNAYEAIAATPYLGVSNINIDDSEGNDDGLINPGEHIFLDLHLTNTMDDNFEDLYLEATTSSDYITLIDEDPVAMGDIDSQENTTFEQLIAFEVSDSIPGGYTFEIQLDIFPESDPNFIWTSYFEETAYAPNLQVVSLEVYNESDTDEAKGQLLPGEKATLLYTITNAGQVPSEQLTIAGKASDPIIFYDKEMITADVIEAGEKIQVAIDVAVHPNVPQGYPTSLELEILSGAYRIMESFARNIGMIMEDWSSGDFSDFEWYSGGIEDWFLTESEYVDGGFSARSGEITHSQQSELLLDYHVLTEDSIAFHRKVSSERNRDWLEFYIDDELMGRWSGSQNWSRVSFPVEKGERTFRWVYIKDPTVSIGEDCAWIDNIQFPAKYATAVAAGFDKHVCEGELAELSGFVTRHETLEWTTDGDGHFSAADQLNTTYTPGETDMLHRQARITLQAVYGEEDPVEDSFLLEIASLPEVDLGPDIVICESDSVVLDVGEDHASVLWSDGSVASTLLVTFEEFGPESEIWVVAANDYGCSTSDTLTVVFEPYLGIGEGDTNEEFIVYPNPATDYILVYPFAHEQLPATVSLLKQNGATLRSVRIQENNEGPIRIDLSGIPAGVYFVQIAGTKVTTIKVIVI